jgi:hypothetical protein
VKIMLAAWMARRRAGRSAIGATLTATGPMAAVVLLAVPAAAARATPATTVLREDMVLATVVPGAPVPLHPLVAGRLRRSADESALGPAARRGRWPSIGGRTDHRDREADVEGEAEGPAVERLEMLRPRSPSACRAPPATRSR